MIGASRRDFTGTFGVALVGVELVTRVVAGGPYPGATALLVLACGIATLPIVPEALDRPVLRAAVVPALGTVSFEVVLTTVSIVGIRLGDVSIRAAVAAFVAALAVLARSARVRRSSRPHRGSGTTAYAATALAVVVAVGLAVGWDIVGPYPPDGVDWAHYLLYADEVERQRSLLIDDVYAGEPDRLFADSPGVGALYGGVRILDGVSSEWLSYGIVVLAALTVLSMFAAAGALWGVRAGLVAAAFWAISPIHIDPLRWHGVGTNLAMIQVPLVVLALGLLYRGVRSWRVVALLGASLLGVAVAHATSSYVVAFFVGTALVIDVVRQAVRHGRSVGAWWRHGIFAPVLASLAGAAIVGAGVLVHLRAQSADLGTPVSFRLFEPDWVSWDVIVDYYSRPFLVLATASLAVALATRRLRRDAALLAVLALVAGCVVVGELWRLEIPFEYRRVVFYAGVALSMLIGAASTRLRPSVSSLVGTLAVLAYLTHISVGLGLPERLLSGQDPKGRAAETIRRFAASLERGEVRDAEVLVADRCHNFVVPYLLRRPTIVAYEPWQVGFESRIPLAEKAATILGGGRVGRRLATSLHVGYVVANPACTPDLPSRLGGSVVVETPNVVIVDVRGSDR